LTDQSIFEVPIGIAVRQIYRKFIGALVAGKGPAAPCAASNISPEITCGKILPAPPQLKHHLDKERTPDRNSSAEEERGQSTNIDKIDPTLDARIDSAVTI
jgi:hypothetical protein